MELGSVCMHGDVLMTKCHLSPTVCFDLYRRPLSAGTDLTFNYNAPTSESITIEIFRYTRKYFFFVVHNHSYLTLMDVELWDSSKRYQEILMEIYIVCQRIKVVCLP